MGAVVYLDQGYDFPGCAIFDDEIYDLLRKSVPIRRIPTAAA